MYDALTELADLSLMLQKKDIGFVKAHSAISREVRVLLAMVDKPGDFARETLDAIKAMKFQNVPLTVGSKQQIEIRHGQFFTSLSANLEKRMMTTRSSGKTGHADEDKYAQDYKNLLRSPSTLDPDTWPDDIAENVLYGEVEISLLCRRFCLPERLSIQGFREYKDNGGKRCPNDLVPLKRAIGTLVVSTADCERGFSQMNVIMTPTRNSLTINRLSNLMFIKCVGPPLTLFKPLSYVKTWLVKGHVTSDDIKARVRNVESVDSNALWALL